MVATREPRTIADFEAFLETQQESPHIYELINGEIVAVPSNPFVSMITGFLFAALSNFLREHKLGYVTVADGGFHVGDSVYAPDIAYVSFETQRTPAHKGFNPVPPDLAVEVISDPKNATELRVLSRKIFTYASVGTQVWVVDPFAQTVEIYETGASITTLERDDTLTSAMLPGFSLLLSDIFVEPDTDQDA